MLVLVYDEDLLYDVKIMSELWLPGTKAVPDLDNVFDMMEFQQSEIDLKSEYDEQLEFALAAAEILTEVIKSMRREERSVTLTTQLAVIQSHEKQDTHIFVKDVGVIGDVADANVVLLGEKTAPLFAIEMDVSHFFRPDNPDDTDLVLAKGNVPISHVRYIERIAG